MLNNPFPSRRNNKRCDISFFMFCFCGESFRCNIAATTFSFAAYVLWVGMWLSFCCFDLGPLVFKLCCSKPHNSSKCVIFFNFMARFCGEVLDEI